MKELQPYKVQQIIPSSTGQIWKDVPADTIVAAFGPLDLTKFTETNPATLLIQFTKGSSHAGTEISNQKKVALANKFKNKFEYIGNSEK